MDRHTIDNDVYERYVDATVALFMEYYSASLLPESVRAELDMKENGDIIFPEKLDQRCRQLIKKEIARQNRRQFGRTLSKGLKYVASCAIVILALSSFLFMTVEAIRIPIINYYIEQFGDHWEITDQKNSDTISGDNIDIADPLGGFIPDDYQLTFHEGNAVNEITAIYKNSFGKRIFFSAKPGDQWIAIDSENAQISQQCQICGHDAIFVIKDGITSLTWVHKELSTVFSLVIDDMSDSDVLSVATQLINALKK